MADNVKEEAQEETTAQGPQGPQPQQMVGVRDYFTKEINETIYGMSESEMFQELRNLEQTRAWIAILRYNQIRLSYSQAAVFGGDAFRDPAGITRNQGVMLGISDLQNAVIQLVQDREAEMKAQESTDA